MSPWCYCIKNKVWASGGQSLWSPRIPNTSLSLFKVASPQGLLEYGRISSRILTGALIHISILNWTVAAYEQLRCVWDICVYIYTYFFFPEHEKDVAIFTCHNTQLCSTDLLSAFLIKYTWFSLLAFINSISASARLVLSIIPNPHKVQQISTNLPRPKKTGVLIHLCNPAGRSVLSAGS